MRNPLPLQQLRQLSSWHVNSHRVARRNALVAHRALTNRRRERVEVEEFLEQHLADQRTPEPALFAEPGHAGPTA
jgi:hypothetical protein